MRTRARIQLVNTVFIIFLLPGCKDKEPDIDYRDKYTGDWAFKVCMRVEEVGLEEVSLDDSSYLVGEITKGIKENTLSIKYTDFAKWFSFNFNDPSNTSFFDGLNEYSFEGGFIDEKKVILTHKSWPPGDLYTANIKGEKLVNGVIPKNKPEACTQPASKVMRNKAILNGSVAPYCLQTNIRFEYGLTIDYGSVTGTMPASADGFSLVDVSANITGLKSSVVYHFRIRAENDLGVAYGSDKIFTTLTEPVQDIENNSYNTVQIGTQIWLAENLKSTKYKDGTAIPLVTENSLWAGLSSEAYCWYNNDAGKYKTVYGALYNWYAVSSGKLCPEEWHVPSETDWQLLLDYLGGNTLAGKKLKEEGTEHWSKPNLYTTNETSFSALPGGIRYEYGNPGSFNDLLFCSYLWTSTEYSEIHAKSKILNSHSQGVFNEIRYKTDGLSVRCIKNN